MPEDLAPFLATIAKLGSLRRQSCTPVLRLLAPEAADKTGPALIARWGLLHAGRSALGVLATLAFIAAALRRPAGRREDPRSARGRSPVQPAANAATPSSANRRAKPRHFVPPDRR